MTNRTRGGSVSAAARRKHGMRQPNRTGKFPIFDRQSALSALRLRGHANTRAERESILRRAARYAPAAARKARMRDRASGKI